MKEHTYSVIGEHTENIGKTTFIVTSFSDNDSRKTAEQLLVDLLRSKILNNETEEKTA